MSTYLERLNKKKKENNSTYDTYLDRQEAQNIRDGKDTLFSDYQNLINSHNSTIQDTQKYSDVKDYNSGINYGNRDSLHNSINTDYNNYQNISDRLKKFRNEYVNMYGEDNVKTLEEGLSSIGNNIHNVSSGIENLNNYWDSVKKNFKTEDDWKNYQYQQNKEKDYSVLSSMTDDEIIDALRYGNDKLYRYSNEDNNSTAYQSNIVDYIKEKGSNHLLNMYQDYLHKNDTTDTGNLLHSLTGLDWFDKTYVPEQEEINEVDNIKTKRSAEELIDNLYNKYSKEKDWGEMTSSYDSDNTFYDKSLSDATSKGELNKQSQVYVYLANKYGKDKADEYRDSLSEYNNLLQRETEVQEAQQFSQEHPVLGTLRSFGTNLGSAISLAPVVDTVNTAIGNNIDTNDVFHQPTHVTNALRNQVANDIDSNVGRFIYQTANSAIDSAINMGVATALTGGVGAVGETVGSSALASAPKYTAEVTSALMGNSVATNAIIEGKEKGYSDVKAVTLGIIQGAIEGITEKYSIDRIIKNPNLLKSAVTEGTEEVASNWMNNIVDAVANGDKSEFNQFIKAYKEENPDATDGKAFSMAILNSLKDDGLAFLGGAIAGGAMAGTQQGINYVGNSLTGKDIKNLDNVNTLVEIGSNLDTNGKAYKISSEISEKLANNKSVSNNLVGKLRNEIINETQQASNADLSTAIENRLVTLGEKSAKAQYLSNVAVKVINGESLSTEEKVALGGSTQAQRVISEYNNSDKSNYTNEWSNNIQSKARTFNAMAQFSDKTSLSSADVTKANVPIVGVNSVNNGDVTYNLSNGKTAKANELKLSNGFDVINNYAKSMNTEEANNYVAGYKELSADVNPETYNALWTIAKEAGINDNQQMLQEVANREDNVLSSKSLLNAFKAGVKESAKTKNNGDTIKQSEPIKVDNNIKSEINRETVYNEYAPQHIDNISTYENMFSRVYTAGTRGVTYKSLSNNINYADVMRELGETEIKDILSAGKNDYNSTLKNENETNREKKKGEVKVYDDVYNKLFSNAKTDEDYDKILHIDTLNSIAETLGTDIVVEDIEDNNINGYIENGVIHINVNKTTEGILFTATHESVHFLRMNNEKGYRALRDFVFDCLTDKGVNIDSRVSNVIDTYLEKNALDINNLTDGAEEEIIANAFGSIIGNEQAMQKAYNLSTEKKNSIISAIRNIIDRLKSFLKSLTNMSEVKALKDDINAQIKMAEIFADGLEKSNVQQSGQKNNTTKNSSTKLSYAGKKAKTANIARLEQAIELEKNGENSEDIRKETGWFRGYEGKWRFEIDDSKLTLTEDNIQTHYDVDGDSYKTAKLYDVVKHNELFEAYPELKDYTIIIQETTTGTQGMFFPNDKQIVISNELFKKHTKAYDDYLNGVRKSEIEKIEQTPEYKEYSKFHDDEEYSNMDPVEWLSLEKEAREKFFNSELGKQYYNLVWGKPNFKTIEEGWSENSKEVLIHEIQHAIQHIEGYAQGSNGSNKNYYKVAGEIESRDVQNRINLSFEQRKNIRPDIDRTDVMFDEDKANTSFAKLGETLPGTKFSVYESGIETQIKSATDNIGTFDKNNPDIRYSIDGDMTMTSEMMSEVETEKALEQTNNLTAKLLNQLFKDNKVTKSSFTKAAEEVLSKYESTMSANSYAEAMWSLAGFARNNDNVTPTDLMTQMSQISNTAVDKTKKVIDTFEEERKEIRGQLKGRTLLLTDRQVQMLDYGMGTNRYKQSMFGTTNIKKAENHGSSIAGGIDRQGGKTCYLSEMYYDLQDQFGYALFPEIQEDMMPEELLRVLETLKPTIDTVDGANRYDMSMAMTQDFIVALCSEVQNSTNTKLKQKYDKAIKELKDSQKEWKERYSKAYKEKYAKKISELKKSNSEAMDKALNKQKNSYEKKIAEIKSKQKTVNSKRQETVLRKDSMQKIRNICSRLEKMTSKEVKKEGIPMPVDLIREVTRLGTVLDYGVTKSGNTYSGQNVLNRISQLYKQLSDKKAIYNQNNSSADGLTNGIFAQQYSEKISEAIDSLKNEVGNTPLNRLDGYQLAHIANVLGYIEDNLRKAKNIVIDGKNHDIAKLGKQATKEILSLRGIQNDKGQEVWYKKTSMWLESQMSDGVRLFKRLGNYDENSVFYKLGEDFDKAESKMINIQMESKNHFVNVQNKYDKELKNINGKNATPLDFGLSDRFTGEKVYITADQALSIYLASENMDNRRHFMVIKDIHGNALNNPDGYMIENIKDKRKGKNRVVITEQNLLDITDYITKNKALKELAGVARSYFNTVAKKYLDECATTLYGYPISIKSTYFPISVNKDYVNTEFESVIRDATLENRGFTKHRTVSSNAVNLIGCMEIVENHINQTARYASFTPVIKNFQKIYNYRAKGSQYTLKEAIRVKMGKSVVNYIDKLMGDIQAPKQSNKFLSKIRGNFAQGVLAMNIKVSMKQAASYPTAAAIIGWKPIKKALAFGENAEGEKKYVFYRANRAEIIEKLGTGVLWDRYQGDTIAEMRGLVETSDWTKKGVMPYLMNWIQKIDTATTGRLYQACKYYVEDELKIKKFDDKGEWTQEYKDALLKTFEKVIKCTQPQYTVMHRPQVLRSNNEIVRTMFMFMTQRLQNIGILYESVGNYRAKLAGYKSGNTTKEDLHKAKVMLTRSVTSQVVASITLVTMDLLCAIILGNLDKYRDDDDELTASSVLNECVYSVFENLIGNVLGGAELFELTETIVKSAKGETTYSNDIISYGALETINDIADELVTLTKLSFGGDVSTDKVTKLAKKIVTSLGQLTGVPTRNAYNIINGMIQQVENISAGEYVSQNELSSADYSHSFYVKMIDGDKDGATKVIEKAKENGITDSNFKSALKNVLMEDDTVIQAAIALNDGNTSEMNKCIDVLVSLGFARNVVEKAVESYANKMKKADKPKEKEDNLSADNYIN